MKRLVWKRWVAGVRIRVWHDPESGLYAVQAGEERKEELGWSEACAALGGAILTLRGAADGMPRLVDMDPMETW